jgi:hypothetical protein
MQHVGALVELEIQTIGQVGAQLLRVFSRVFGEFAHDSDIAMAWHLCKYIV